VTTCACAQDERYVSVRSAVPGADGKARYGCEFGSFFSCVDGATPSKLLKRGIYSEIAVALKGGPWREASIAMLAMTFGLSKEEAEAQAAGQDVLGYGIGFAESSLHHGLTKIGSRLGRVRRRTSKGRVSVASVDTSATRPHRAEENAASETSAATFDPLEVEAGEGGSRA
jgi:hypothetical protein